MGTINTFNAKLYVDPNVPPRFFKACTVPYAMKGAIEEELDRWEREGIVEKVTHSEWATPLPSILANTPLNMFSRVRLTFSS